MRSPASSGLSRASSASISGVMRRLVHEIARLVMGRKQRPHLGIKRIVAGTGLRRETPRAVRLGWAIAELNVASALAARSSVGSLGRPGGFPGHFDGGGGGGGSMRACSFHLHMENLANKRIMKSLVSLLRVDRPDSTAHRAPLSHPVPQLRRCFVPDRLPLCLETGVSCS